MATTRTSLEVTKGGSVVEPHPVERNSRGSVSAGNSSDDDDAAADLLRPAPTEEEWATLPRVPGSIPWTAWTVAFVEFVERFSYYGTSAVCKWHLLGRGRPTD